MDICTLALFGYLCFHDNNKNSMEPIRYEYTEQNKRNRTSRSRLSNKRFTRCGRASWYGKGSSGSRTANGERFKPGGNTAASWDYRFNSRILVFNPENGRSVIVRINDRGPAKRLKRLIDLSEGAFKQIANLSKGVVRVCIKEL